MDFDQMMQAYLKAKTAIAANATEADAEAEVDDLMDRYNATLKGIQAVVESSFGEEAAKDMGMVLGCFDQYLHFVNRIREDF